MDIQVALDRIKEVKGLRNDKEIAPLLGLSAQNFSNRKKRGTLLSLIVDWAADEGFNAAYILYGEGSLRVDQPSSDDSIPSSVLTVVAAAQGESEAKSIELTREEVVLLSLFRQLSAERRHEKIIEIGYSVAASNIEGDEKSD